MSRKSLVIFLRAISFLVFILLLMPTGVQAQEKVLLAEFKGRNFNSQIFKHQKTGDKLELRISLSSIVPNSYFTLENPNRFVVDLRKSSIEKNTKLKVKANPFIKAVRIGSEGGRVRIVVDLMKESLPDVKMRQDKNTLIFYLNSANEADSQENARIAALQSELTQQKTSLPEITPLVETEAGPPQISVDKVWVSFDSDSRRIQDLHVKNIGISPVRLVAQVKNILQPGEDSEKSEISDDVLVSPERLSLQPGEEKTVRIVLGKKDREIEENYLIVFNADSSLNPQTSSGSTHAAPPALIVTVAALPSEADPSLDWEIQDNFLKIKNLGNVSVFLDSGLLCSRDKDACSALPSRRLYPGNSWSMDVTGKSQAEFVRRSGEESQQLIIPLTITVNIPSAA